MSQSLRIRWPKYWSFSFSINLPNEHSGLISFRMDWLGPLAVQESPPTPQFKSINSLVLSILHGLNLTSIHAAAAKSLESCLTLCDPRDGSPSSSPVPGILQARTLEWVVIAFSHPYMTTGKTIALTRWTFVGKVLSLLFSVLSRLVFPSGSDGKASVCNAGDLGSIPGSGRFPGEENGYPLQYSCLRNPMDYRL